MKNMFILAIAFATIGLAFIGCNSKKTESSGSNSVSSSVAVISESKPSGGIDGGIDSNLILPTGEGWVRELANDFLGVYIFNADNTYESFMLLEGELDPDAPNVNGTYTIDGDEITMIPDGLSSGSTFTYSVDGNSVTFGSYTYTRQTVSK